MTDESKLATIVKSVIELKSKQQRQQLIEEASRNDLGLRGRLQMILDALPAGEATANQPIADPISNDSPAAQPQCLPVDDISEPAPNASVLLSLKQSLDPPQVVLDDSIVDEPGPILQPTSPEMPKTNPESRYQLQGEIARGGMGAILKGRDVDLGRNLAIKVLLDAHKDNPHVIQRFIEEAQIGGQLQHPGIAPVYELGQFDDNRPFFTMKLVKGETLAYLLATRRSLEQDRAKLLGIFEQVCQTMAYAHSRRVIHRDLKSANIMVGAFGEVQVMDWGLAKVLPKPGETAKNRSAEKAGDAVEARSVIQTLRSGGSDVPLGSLGSVPVEGSNTQLGSALGTPAYMPPEQALGQVQEMDRRSDIFGLGAILCEILTGQPPYVADTTMEIMRLASRGKLDECFSRLDRCGADTQLVDIAKDCLAVEQADRPEDAGVLATSMTAYLESVEVQLRETEVRRAEETARAIEERKRRRVTAALAASVLIFAAACGGSWIWLQQQRTQRQLVALSEFDSALNDAKLHQRLSENVGLVPQETELSKAIAMAQQAIDLAEKADPVGERVQAARALHDELNSKLSQVRLAVQQQRHDEALRSQLELIRATHANDQDVGVMGVDNSVSFDRTDSRYRHAFLSAGYDFDTTSVTGLAEQIESSSIREDLIASIDHWRQIVPQPSDSDAFSHLTVVVNTADPDEWRKSVRAALDANDATALRRLAFVEEASDQSAALAAWMGSVLRQSGHEDLAIRVLTAVQPNYPADFWLNLELAESLAGKNAPQALSYARAAFASRPGSNVARWTLVTRLADADKTDESLNLFNGMLRTGDLSSDDCTRMAADLLQQDRPEHALAAALKANKLEPSSAHAHAYRALSLIGLERKEEALAAATTAVKLDGEDPLCVHCLAYSSHLNGQHEAALAAAEKRIELQPTNAYGYLVKAQFLAGQKQYSDAESAIREALSIAPNHTLAKSMLFGILMRKQLATGNTSDGQQPAPELGELKRMRGAMLAKDAQTEKTLVKILEQNPANIDRRIELARIYLLRWQVDKAAEQYRRVLEFDPDHAAAHFGLGRSHFREQNLDEAIDHFLKAVELAPKYSAYHAWLGLAFEEKATVLGDSLSQEERTELLERSLDYFSRAVEIMPNHPFARRDLIRLLRLQGENSAADVIEEAFSLLDPKAALSQLLREGAKLSAEHRFADGEAAFREALELSPKNRVALISLGDVLALQRKFAESLNVYQRLLEQNPEDATVALVVAELQLATGDFDAGVETSRAVLAKDPESAWAHRVLATAFEEQGDQDKAIQECQAALDIAPEDPLCHACLAMCLIANPEYPSNDVFIDLALLHAEAAVEGSAGAAPDDAAYCLNALGIAHFRAAEWQSALDSFNAAIELARVYANVTLFVDPSFVAMTHWKLGNQTEARRWYSMALNESSQSAFISPKRKAILDEAASLLKVVQN